MSSYGTPFFRMQIISKRINFGLASRPVMPCETMVLEREVNNCDLRLGESQTVYDTIAWGYDILITAHSLRGLSVYSSYANDSGDLKSGFTKLPGILE